MYNTSLLVFFVVILGTTWAHKIEERVEIVIGSRHSQAENNPQPTQAPNGNNPSTVVEYILGSVTNQTRNRYALFGKVKEIDILVPYTYDPRNGAPQNIEGIINGPSSSANIMSQVRHQVIQQTINFLTKSCQDFKIELYELIKKGKNVRTIADINMQVMSIESSLQNEQYLLDDFNNIKPSTPPKVDYFDRDLLDIHKQIQELKNKSLLATAL
ncbi:GSCOCT00013105001.2-RA-CDS [Cotesia congregata]|uniref:Cc_bv3.2_18.1b n=2 Tax=root TaxID=1 RepID=S6D2Z5_COTCN|nr:GSCOCT00013105001.2-RA-CDS [Cotesia congregata]CAG5092548.1 cc_bv3.2_18.1b [Cotesia congregata]CCQ71268.1 hypothetical protein BV3-2 [Cotesia congregata]